MSGFNFEEVNKLADEYFMDESNLTLRTRIMELMTGPVSNQIDAYYNETHEGKEKNQNKNSLETDGGLAIKVSGRKVNSDECMDVLFLTLLGVNLKGESVPGKFDPERGTKFTTYFFDKLEKYHKSVYAKESNRRKILSDSNKHNPDYSKKAAYEDAEDGESELVAAYEEEYYDCESDIMFVTAKFFSEMIKADRCPHYSRGYYSFVLINYTRGKAYYFDAMNKYTDVLFYPYEYDYICRMTTYPENVTEDFNGLVASDFSEYVYNNELYKKNNNTLERKTLAEFYGVSEPAVSKWFVKFSGLLSESLRPSVS